MQYYLQSPKVMTSQPDHFDLKIVEKTFGGSPPDHRKKGVSFGWSLGGRKFPTVVGLKNLPTGEQMS